MSATGAPAPSTHRARLLNLSQRLDDKRLTFEQNKDVRAIFTFAYVEITRSLASSIDSYPFKDPGWVVDLAEAFAGQYFLALLGDSGPGAWETVFAVNRRRGTSVAENLIFSITAHIVHDLPLALDELQAAGAVDPHIGDFHAMNEVLAKNIVGISESVTKRYEPFFYWLERFQEHEVQIITNYGFRLSRGMAWYNMVRLRSDNRRATLASLDKSVQIVIDAIRRPPYVSAAILLRLLRIIASLTKRWPRPATGVPNSRD